MVNSVVLFVVRVRYGSTFETKWPNFRAVNYTGHLTVGDSGISILTASAAIRSV